MPSWIFIVLAHWNNSLWIDMSTHSDTLFWFWANQSALSPQCCVLRGEATNTNFILFGLTWLGLEPTIYHTRSESFYWYWRNCWPSLFKLYFHNWTKKGKKTCTCISIVISSLKSFNTECFLKIKIKNILKG